MTLQVRFSDITQVYPNEVVQKEFLKFLEKTSEINENQEILIRIGQNFRLKFDDWPTAVEALKLFQANMYKMEQITSLNAKRRSVKWNDGDKKLFYWIVIRYHVYKSILDNRQLMPQEWREISKMVIGRNAHQCRLKWEQKYKIPLSDAPWTEEEDYLLSQVHEQALNNILESLKSKGKKISGHNQPERSIKDQIIKYFASRSNVENDGQIDLIQISLSMLSYYLSDPWNKQQEIDLLKTILMKGKKWSELSILYGRVRTENSLKNKYNSLLKKEKMKYEFETINSALFEKVQQLRKDYSKRYGNITSIEEIDNYEWQFIVLAIQGLYIELCTQEGRLEEAKKIQNDDFFDLFHEDQTNQTQNSTLYKKTLNIQKVEQKFQINNDQCGIVILNQKNKKLYITPYNALDFKSLILNQIAKRVKIESTDSCISIDHNNNFHNSQARDSSGTQSIQQLLFLASHSNYFLPMGQSMFNSYWLPPVFSQGMHSQRDQMNYQFNSSNLHFNRSSEKLRDDFNQRMNETNQKQENIDDLFEHIGVDIKVVDSDNEK